MGVVEKRVGENDIVEWVGKGLVGFFGEVVEGVLEWGFWVGEVE